MNIEKIRNLTDTELSHQQRELADQLFKLKFQLNMGQTESLKKIREMRKDIARINTVAREKQIAGSNGSVQAKPVAAKAKPVAAKAKPVRAKAKPVKAKAHKPAAAKKAAKKKTAATEKK
jgi:large subunit ribosomal protein L29